MRFERMCLSLIVLFVVALATQQVYATDTMRCGNKLIRTGDTKGYVLSKCGEPDSRDYIGTDTHINYSAGAISERTIEEWHYNLGPRKFMRLLRFKGSRLISIQDGERGY